MGSSLSTLRTDVRSRIIEPSADFFADSELNTWINDGYRNLVLKSEWCEKIQALVTVAGQFEYSLPSDVFHVNQVMWDDRWPVSPRDIEDFRRYVSTANTTQSIRPFVYRIFPWDGKIRLYPIPNTSISTTLNGALSSSATTIPVTDASGFMPIGRIIIGSEQILYEGVSGNSLTNCIRGDGFTTAASHNNLDPVSVGRCEIYYSYVPPDLASDSDTTRLTIMMDEALVCYATSVAFTKRDKYSQAAFYMKRYDDFVAQARSMKDQRDRDRLYAIKDDYPEWLM
jgi:hypothetical protein